MTPATDLIYAYRITRLPLLDAGGAPIGNIDDIVVVPGRGTEAPRVLGFVASSQRRRIFITAARVVSLDNTGVRPKSYDIDLNPFRLREGERLLAADVLDKKHGDETVVDVALQHHGGHNPSWSVTKVRLAKRGALLARPSFRLVEWTDLAALFAPATPVAAEAARLRNMHPSDVPRSLHRCRSSNAARLPPQVERAVRTRRIRTILRSRRAQPRHCAVLGGADVPRHRVDHHQRGVHHVAVGPLSLHFVEPHVLRADRVCSTTHFVGTEPPGRPRPSSARERPRSCDAHARERRVSRPRIGWCAPCTLQYGDIN